MSATVLPEEPNDGKTEPPVTRQPKRPRLRVVVDRDAEALALFLDRAHWHPAHRKRDGHPFFIIPGSKPGTAWWADLRNCSCPDHTRSLQRCKHIRAVVLWFAAYQRGEITATGLTRTDASHLATQAEANDREDDDEQAKRARVASADDWQAYDDDIEAERYRPQATPELPGRPVWLEAGDSYGPHAVESTQQDGGDQ